MNETATDKIMEALRKDYEAHLAHLDRTVEPEYVQKTRNLLIANGVNEDVVDDLLQTIAYNFNVELAI